MLSLLFFLFTNLTYASDTITTIAVIDTGFGFNKISRETKYLCKRGHRDFSKDQQFLEDLYTLDKVPQDIHGHGTNIAGVIIGNGFLAKKPFCLVILKYFDSNASGTENLNASIKALEYAINIKADYINYSGGGPSENIKETELVKKFLDNGGTFVAAAGNERSNLSKSPFYPAMSDPRVIVVGNMYEDTVTKELKRSPASNCGTRVNRWEFGDNVTAFNIRMTGTSQAAAVATGKILVEKEQTYDKNKKNTEIACDL